MKLPRSWPNSSESTSPVGIAPQFTRTNGRARAPRAGVNRASDDFLAGPGLAEDQHRRVGRRDLRDAVHDRAQPRVLADDGVGDVLPIEPREQRALVGLEGFAQSRHLVQPGVVRERHPDRLEQRLRRAPRARCRSVPAPPPAPARRAAPLGAERTRDELAPASAPPAAARAASESARADAPASHRHRIAIHRSKSVS